jgi:hypothetical protein
MSFPFFGVDENRRGITIQVIRLSLSLFLSELTPATHNYKERAFTFSFFEKHAR